jgi:hypothetical protein
MASDAHDSVTPQGGADATSPPLTNAPACPKCGGRMWDNRLSKRNPRAPDFKCRDRRCDGVVWPGEHHAARPIFARSRASESAPVEHESAHRSEHVHESEARESSRSVSTNEPVRTCYLDVTDFVLAKVRPRYEAAGLTCTDATVATIAATLFIGLCTTRGASTPEAGR